MSSSISDDSPMNVVRSAAEALAIQEDLPSTGIDSKTYLNSQVSETLKGFSTNRLNEINSMCEELTFKVQSDVSQVCQNIEQDVELKRLSIPIKDPEIRELFKKTIDIDSSISKRLEMESKLPVVNLLQ